jgi:4-hydroxy-tetrahydrodipicolinate reductase
LGTTGYAEKEKEMIQEASKQIPVLYSPNFSLGMAACMEAAVLLAKKFGGDLEIVEIHRRGKKDKPSGTALEMKAQIGNTEIPIHSLRSGDVMGVHTLFLSSEGESIELKHQVHSRDAFARGALRAALFLIRQPPGLYSVKDLFS